MAPEDYLSDNTGYRTVWGEDRGFLDRLVLVEAAKGGEKSGLASFASDTDRKISEERLIQNPPVFFERNLHSMVGVANSEDVDIMLSTWAGNPRFGDYVDSEAFKRGHREHNRIMKDVAEQNGIPLFDFNKTFPKNKSYWSDGRYVNEEGGRIEG